MVKIIYIGSFNNDVLRVQITSKNLSDGVRYHLFFWFKPNYPVHVLVAWVSDLGTCIIFWGKGVVHVLISKPKHKVPRCLIKIHVVLFDLTIHTKKGIFGSCVNTTFQQYFYTINRARDGYIY